jgi:hypothetical protein
LKEKEEEQHVDKNVNDTRKDEKKPKTPNKH